jgi:hypothetical protein
VDFGTTIQANITGVLEHLVNLWVAVLILQLTGMQVTVLFRVLTTEFGHRVSPWWFCGDVFLIITYSPASETPSLRRFLRASSCGLEIVERSLPDFRLFVHFDDNPQKRPGLGKTGQRISGTQAFFLDIPDQTSKI